MHILIKIFGLALAGTLFVDSAVEFFGLAGIPPIGRMIIAAIIAIVAVKF